eukprot:TRINITY_DN946_c0_g1_i1.p1 TRINITY_DN946_c0_g1~~TRINITY_DN946_c0_g1_i1.p1  ORF type:complete len:82 (-),score=20.03 TRINITY_DN946_c0_g1_i1:341-550(-)
MGLAALLRRRVARGRKNWKYLPYNPISGNACDEALGEQLNTWEIDVNITRLKQKRKERKRKRQEYLQSE